MLRNRSRFWSEQRPTLETITASAAWAPVIGWLGNPGWWVDTLPRLAHYYQINTDRQGALPNIQILYLGRIYEYSLPWHNGFLMVAVTVPVLTLAAAAVGMLWGVSLWSKDRLPLYFAMHMMIQSIFFASGIFVVIYAHTRVATIGLDCICVTMAFKYAKGA
jgi:hypothetical protein